MAFSPLAYPGTRQTFLVSALAVAPALYIRPGETFVITSPAVVAAGYDIGARFCEVDPNAV